MNTGLPKWTRWLIMLAFLGLLSGAALFFIQSEVQKQVRTALEETARQNDATLTLKDVRYNLLTNMLTIQGAEAKFSMNGTPMVYSVEQIDIFNPNRPLALAFAQQKLDDVRGIHPLAEAMDVRNLTIGPDMTVKVAVQHIEGISANMDVLRELLAKDKPSVPETTVALAEALAYKVRVVSGMESSVKEGDIAVLVTVGGMLEKDYANFALDSLTVTDTVVKMQQGSTSSSFTLKKLGLERMTLSKAFFQLAMTANPADEEATNKLFKSLFLGERPFIASITLDDMLLVTPTLNVPVKSFRYENSSTSPFALRMDLKGLTLPSALLFDGPSAVLMSGLPTITYNSSLSALVPFKDPKALTKIATQSSIDNLGSLDMEIDSLMDFSLTNPEAVADISRLARLKIAFTDDGLTPRAARASQALMGADLSKLGALGTELLWNAVPQDQRTPQNRVFLEQFMSFVQKPGSIELTVTPPYPMTAEELEQAKLDSGMIKVSVTSGLKPLEELVQALPK